MTNRIKSKCPKLTRFNNIIFEISCISSDTLDLCNRNYRIELLEFDVKT